MEIQFYSKLRGDITAVISGEVDAIANLANTSSLISTELNGIKNHAINWVGFYLNRGGQLVLGPFQGKVACIRINFGRGVCGTAAQTKTTQLVPDVHKFPGHIACDSVSNSEIVIPLVVNGNVVGVLDIDSSVLSCFTEEDKVGLEAICEVLVGTIKWDQIQNTGQGECKH